MSAILDQIKGHDDIKALTDRQLKQLAEEARRYIIGCVSANGGHLASNLGAVELTLALLSEFDPDADRIVWDVGHQSYTFKMFTGRKDALQMIRSEGGPSGFPTRKESSADCFGTGHASTSISAALGMAAARRMMGRGCAVIAVIGDGALTGGMAYEAMNNAGFLKEDLIVVLNDNERAISANTGSIADFLARVRFSPARRRFEGAFKQMLSYIPILGGPIRQAGHLLKRSLKGLLLPKMLFEEMGFTYIGPLDGHNIRLIRGALSDARKLGGPVMIHLVTKKGKGYEPAEQDPCGYHGTGPFDPKVGAADNGAKPGFTKVFSDKLIQIASADPRVAAITAAMPDGTGLDCFKARFPERYFDVGIAEEHAVTFAAGLAAEGMIPVIAVYSTFLQRAFDQMIHDIALQGLHVVLAVDRAGIVGEDGATHQGAYDLCMASCAPGFTVLSPSDASDLRSMMDWAVRDATGPVLIRYAKQAAAEGEPDKFVPGRARILRQGSGLAIISAGPVSLEAVKAAGILSAEGIDPTVVDVRSVKPIDEGLLRGVLRTHGAALTVEEGVARGGLFAAVSLLRDEPGMSTVIPHGLPEEPILHASRKAALRRIGFDAEGIAEAARRAMSKAGVGR